MNPQPSSRPLPDTPDGTRPAGAASDWASPGETPPDAPPPAASPLGDPSRVMLQQIIDVGTRLVGARYGALGIFDDSGSEIVQYITSGIEESVREAIGPLPVGKGLLGLHIREPRPHRIADIGKDPRSVGFPPHHPPMTSFLCVPLKSGEKVHGSLYFTDKQGAEEFTLEDENIAVSFAALAMAAIERESAYHEANVSESRYWETLENIHLISVGLDTEGTISFCNDFLLQLTGWGREEVLGRNWFEVFLPPEIGEDVKSLHLGIVASGLAAPHHENEIVTREGARRLISWNNTILHGPNGDVTGTISIGEDITERKLAEEQLHQSEKLEALGRLSSGVSHDFNNALGIIYGSAEVLERLLRREEIDPSILEYVDIVLKSAMSAAGTVKRLQDFARKREDRPASVADLNEVIREAAEMTSPRWKSEAEAGGILLEFIVEPLARRPVVSGVDTELHEILINLINNSLDAMPEGGRITLTTEDTLVGARVVVTDNGHGMSAEVRARAFEPFFSTKGERGTGMGLSMAFGIVNRYGGTIAIDSEEGAGTRISFSLPSSELAEEDHGEETITHAGPACILIIEDEPDMARVVRDLLEEGGYTVEIAGNGASGVEMFSGAHHDLVISDLAMPGMSGTEVARRIKEISPRTPVFLLTGWQAVMDPEEMTECGVDRVMVKPVKKTELFRNVTDMLTGRG